MNDEAKWHPRALEVMAGIIGLVGGWVHLHDPNSVEWLMPLAGAYIIFQLGKAARGSEDRIRRDKEKP